MQRPSLAHFSRQLSLRYVDLPPGRYQFIIMQRGPPRIGIPHLVATKFKMLRLSLAH
jgi:hypothetical protein